MQIEVTADNSSIPIVIWHGMGRYHVNILLLLQIHRYKLMIYYDHR